MTNPKLLSLYNTTAPSPLMSLSTRKPGYQFEQKRDLVTKTIGNRLWETAHGVAQCDKNYLGKSANRKTQISPDPVSGTNALCYTLTNNYFVLWDLQLCFSAAGSVYHFEQPQAQSLLLFPMVHGIHLSHRSFSMVRRKVPFIRKLTLSTATSILSTLYLQRHVGKFRIKCENWAHHLKIEWKVPCWIKHAKSGTYM